MNRCMTKQIIPYLPPLFRFVASVQRAFVSNRLFHLVVPETYFNKPLSSNGFRQYINAGYNSHSSSAKEHGLYPRRYGYTKGPWTWLTPMSALTPNKYYPKAALVEGRNRYMDAIRDHTVSRTETQKWYSQRIKTIRHVMDMRTVAGNSRPRNRRLDITNCHSIRKKAWQCGSGGSLALRTKI